MIRAFSLAAVALFGSALANAQSAPVLIESKPMRDGSGIVVGRLISATNLTNEVQCVRARMEPALVSGGGIFRPRLVLKPRQRDVPFARFMASTFSEDVMLTLDPEETCPERDRAPPRPAPKG